MSTIPHSTGHFRLRAAGLAVAGIVLAGLAACSAGTSASSSSGSSTTSAASSPATPTATSTAVVTSTNVVTTSVTTETSQRTHPTPTAPPPHPTPGIPCPTGSQLTAVLPAADRAVAVSGIVCSGEWAVGNYSQDGRNQVVGLFHYGTADGHWGVWERTQACAQTVNLPPALYQRACQFGVVATTAGSPTAGALGSGKSYSLTQVVKNSSNVELVLQGAPSVDNIATMTPGYPTTIGPQTSSSYIATNTGNGVQMVLKFQTADAHASLVIDSDVPRTNGNYFNDSISGSGVGFGGASMTSGDNSTATVTIGSCTSECVKLANGKGDLG